MVVIPSDISAELAVNVPFTAFKKGSFTGECQKLRLLIVSHVAPSNCSSHLCSVFSIACSSKAVLTFRDGPAQANIFSCFSAAVMA